jgi:putative membrane protein
MTESAPMPEDEQRAEDADASDDVEPVDGATEMDPRLHYANERTFLAWIRTALALITAGLVITQLLPAFRITGGRRIVGVPLIALGTFLAAASFRQWDVNERAMRAGRPLPESRLPLIVAAGVTVVALLAVVLAATHSVGE